MEEVTLTAPDISCDHCIAAVTRAITKLPGVGKVKGDAEAKRVTISFDSSKTPLALIEKAMEEEGYPVAK